MLVPAGVCWPHAGFTYSKDLHWCKMSSIIEKTLFVHCLLLVSLWAIRIKEALKWRFWQTKSASLLHESRVCNSLSLIRILSRSIEFSSASPSGRWSSCKIQHWSVTWWVNKCQWSNDLRSSILLYLCPDVPHLLAGACPGHFWHCLQRQFTSRERIDISDLRGITRYEAI